MIRDGLSPRKERISTIEIFPFLAMTFMIAWGILALYLYFPESTSRICGQISGNHPLFFLAVYAPAIAAIAIVAFRTGPDGSRHYLARLFRWRCTAGWYAFLLIGVPLVFYAGAAWKGTPATDWLPESSFPSFLIAILLAIIKGPVEELGWRGFALPLLQRRMMPILAAVVLGVIWGVWHLPAFLLSGTQQGAWSFMPFFVGTISISIIMTSLFNASNGSILLPAFMHFQLINPAWPEAQPYDTYILVGVAVLVVWRDRGIMFSKAAAHVEIVPVRR